jgi:ubiquitin-protein ligase
MAAAVLLRSSTDALTNKKSPARVWVGLHTFETPQTLQCPFCEARSDSLHFASHLLECLDTSEQNDKSDDAKLFTMMSEMSCIDCDATKVPLRKMICCRQCVRCKDCVKRTVTRLCEDVTLESSVGAFVCSCGVALSSGDCVAAFGRTFNERFFNAAAHQIVASLLVKGKQTLGGKIDEPQLGALARVHLFDGDEQQCRACNTEHGDEASSLCVPARVFLTARVLAYLASLVGVAADGDRDEAASSSAATATATAGSLEDDSAVWSSGIGFGYDGRSGSAVWKPEEFAERLRSVDDEMAALLRIIVQCVLPDKDGDDDWQAGAAVKAPPAALGFLLRHSAFFGALMRSYLRNDLLSDVVARANVYSSVFALVSMCARVPGLRAVLRVRGSRAAESAATLCTALQHKASTLLSALGDGSNDGDDDAAGDAFLRKLAALDVSAAAAKPRVAESSGSGAVAASSSQSTATTPAAAKADYVATMKPFQFGELALDGDEVPDGYAFKYGANAAAIPRAKLRRLCREIDGLRSDSLITPSKTSILVRVDKARPNRYRVLITGPEGTPYQMGCFVFEITCPENFPNNPPQCNIVSTGQGAAYFGPNLYSDGTVCLSLLGTWSGSPEETWSKSSSLLQLVLSIQCMLLGCDEPYYLEPGYEQNESPDASLEFSRPIYALTVTYAMNVHLENDAESYGFKDAIIAHLRLCYDDIIAYYTRIISDGKASSALPTALDKFKTLMAPRL